VGGVAQVYRLQVLARTLSAFAQHGSWMRFNKVHLALAYNFSTLATLARRLSFGSSWLEGPFVHMRSWIFF
jgi:hypothetical protein